MPADPPRWIAATVAALLAAFAAWLFAGAEGLHGGDARALTAGVGVAAFTYAVAAVR